VRALLLLAAAALGVLSCSAPPETARPAAPATRAGLSREELAAEGHTLAARREWDSATVVLEAALAKDPEYLPALRDLAGLNYDRAMAAAPATDPARVTYLRRSHVLFARLEELGERDADLYERLCETAVSLDDSLAFLRYAKKYAALYPHDRQFYNLGLAYLGVSDFQGAIRSQKEAIEKFPESEYIGSFYRQLGRAYMKVDRDQTAERTLSAGVKAADAKISELKKSGQGDEAPGSPVARLREDRIAMLLMLKKLHQTYKATEKLERVEKDLREAGYVK
jgi:tetratricopeptide (TPR) repeat protein